MSVHVCLLREQLQGSIPTCSKVPTLFSASKALASYWDSIAKPGILNIAASSVSLEPVLA